jgi:hypothetical protein
MKSLLSICLLAVAALLSLSEARAQVDVNIALKRSLYLRYEPVICTVSITNRTGSELELKDTPAHKWFGFQVTRTSDGNPVPPLNEAYANEDVQIGPGQTLTRSINLTTLYPITEFGTYRIQGVVYAASLNKYFSSENLNIEITEGRLIIPEQTVGTPSTSGLEGKERVVSLLAHRLPQTTMVYLRITDPASGIVYCTHQLGRYMSYDTPVMQFDAENNVHILHNTAPKNYLYTVVSLDGRVLKREAYQATTAKPRLVSRSDGSIALVGGILSDPNAPKPKETLSALSDRPVPLPTPQADSTKKKSDDVTPQNLLSR